MYRLIHTESIKNVKEKIIKESADIYNYGNFHAYTSKYADTAKTVHALSGELYLSKSGWLMLSVPNSLVRGAFDALNENGIELPKVHDGKLNSHISVMRPEEIKQIGGADKLKAERGRHFHYTLGPIQEVKPAGWADISKVWFIQVFSNELKTLRKSFGLTPLPNDNKFDFHITIAVRRKSVLQDNEISKQSNILGKALATTGLLSDAAHVKNIFAARNKEIDPVEELAEDESHLTDIREQANSVNRKKKKLIEDAQIKNAEFDCDDETLNGLIAYYENIKKAEEEKKPKHKKPTDLRHLLTKILFPSAAGATAGIGLSAATNKDIPEQVTRFPGNRTPLFIRGRVGNDGISTIENTGHGYASIGGNDYTSHINAPNLSEAVNTLRSRIPQNQRLQILEIQGHGNPAQQDMGDAPPGPDTHAPSINPLTVNESANILRTLPFSDNASLINYGCHTGLGCPPSAATRPEHDWPQHLSNRLGINVVGSRGWTRTENDGNLNSQVTDRLNETKPPTQANTLRLSPRDGEQVGQLIPHHAAENDAWTIYRPNQSQSVHRDTLTNEQGVPLGKQTYFKMPDGKLMDLLYHAGAPSAILGSAINPLINDERKAKLTALATSGLALPMLLSESAARMGQASGNIHTQGIHSPSGLVDEHLSQQSKVLPYLALAGLPLLTYGGAKYLGRWKNKKEQSGKG